MQLILIRREDGIEVVHGFGSADAFILKNIKMLRHVKMIPVESKRINQGACKMIVIVKWNNITNEILDVFHGFENDDEAVRWIDLQKREWNFATGTMWSIMSSMNAREFV